MAHYRGRPVDASASGASPALVQDHAQRPGDAARSQGDAGGDVGVVAGVGAATTGIDMSEQEPHSERGRVELPRWAERLLLRLVPFRNRGVVVGDFVVDCGRKQGG